MTRGLQKQQARANADKRAAAHAGGKSQFQARVEGNKFKCPKCMLMVANYGIMKQHYEAKHPKDACPAEDTFGAAK